MTRIWFASELETVATFWRINRRDGVTIGLTTHDADLWFDGVLHRASPGMVPSAIRKSAGFDPDEAEVRGALTHDAISADDLMSGRFDGAGVRIGLVDWETFETHAIHTGTIGTVAQEDGSFSAQLVSRKAELQRDSVPRTSPACRAQFCGSGCNLDPVTHTRLVRLTSFDAVTNTARFDNTLDAGLHVGGTVRWLDGPLSGSTFGILNATAVGELIFDTPVDITLSPGIRAWVREGCDRTIGTCAARFANAVNFRGEPYLPGNDLLASYPAPSA